MTFSDGTDIKATMVGVDEDKDLAVLAVDPKKLDADVRASNYSSPADTVWWLALTC